LTLGLKNGGGGHENHGVHLHGLLPLPTHIMFDFTSI